MSSRLSGDGHQGYTAFRALARADAGAAGSATIIIVSTRSFAVTGMSCEHCASAIRAEISRLPGITAVDVDVTAGTVRVTGDPVPGDTPLREAVEEAGYEFVG
jgi:copper chaperone